MSKRDKTKKSQDDWNYYAKKDVYPPKGDKAMCLDGKLCKSKVVEFGLACRHGDCTWYCPLKLMREKEHLEFQELFHWMESRK